MATPPVTPLPFFPEVSIDWPIDKDTLVAMVRPDGVTIRTTVGQVYTASLLKLYRDSNLTLENDPDQV
jgi:hypothetical protein